MTLAAQMLTDVADVFLNTDEHAATYTYTPPLAGTPRTVTGIWELGEPRVDKSNGVELVHPATLVVASSETFAREGVLTVNSEAWPVVNVGHADTGMRTIAFERRTKIANGADIRKFK